MRRWFANHPWIWIVIVFITFVAALASLVRIAVRNMPETVSLSGGAGHGGH